MDGKNPCAVLLGLLCTISTGGCGAGEAPMLERSSASHRREAGPPECSYFVAFDSFTLYKDLERGNDEVALEVGILGSGGGFYPVSIPVLTFNDRFFGAAERPQVVSLTSVLSTWFYDLRNVSLPQSEAKGSATPTAAIGSPVSYRYGIAFKAYGTDHFGLTAGPANRLASLRLNEYSSNRSFSIEPVEVMGTTYDGVSEFSLGNETVKLSGRILMLCPAGTLAD